MASRSNKNLTVFYHDIFDYPLTKQELRAWKSTSGIKCQVSSVKKKGNFFFLKGREGIIKKRIQREKYSKNKLKIAKSITYHLKPIPSVLFVGVTGALAMNNASKNSDIDLIIITKQNTLWLTRLCVYIVLITNHYPLRRPLDTVQKDKLCLNIWLDENDLVWDKKDRNMYTAHEIAQIVPLINKRKSYQKFLYKNKWILNFWPSAVGREYMVYRRSYIAKHKTQDTIYNILYTYLNKLAFKFQFLYMKNKITREVVTPTRAIFHPNDWGKKVLNNLNLYIIL